MNTRWISGIELAEDATGAVTSVPILPIGRFSTERYPKIDLSEKVAADLVRNFDERTLKHDIRIDIEHDFREAAGWIRSLEVGTFTHPRSGEDVPGIIASVEWTPVGLKLLSEGQYRYVSAAYGTYRDEESGKRYRNVLMAVALTNDPAMKMLPALEVPTMLSADLAGADVVELHDTDTDTLTSLLVDIASEVRRHAGTDGFRDWLEMRVAELPDEVTAVLTDAGPPTEGGDDAGDDPDEPSPPEGGTKDMSDDSTEVTKADEADDDATAKVAELEAQLSEMRAERKAERVDGVVALLAAKGCTEPTIAGFRALMTADDTSAILLSDEEGTEPVDVVDAVEAIAETLDTTVPIDVEGEQPNEAAAADEAAATDELTEEDKMVAAKLRIDPALMLSSKE